MVFVPYSLLLLSLLATNTRSHAEVAGSRAYRDVRVVETQQRKTPLFKS